MLSHITHRRRLAAAFMIFLAWAVLAAASDSGRTILHCEWPSPNDRSPLRLGFDGDPMIIIPPGENLLLTAEQDGVPVSITLLRDGQPFRQDSSLAMTAPDKPGCYYISLFLEGPNEARPADLCVVVPFKAAASRTSDGFVLRADGEEIGRYRHPNRSGNAKVRGNPESYQPPVWWIRLTELNERYQVVPGLMAGELVVLGEDSDHRHTDLVPVHYPMWNAINTLREALETRGIPGSALRLISMYRSPPYNRSIGSNAFGRHIYGDAFDFYIGLDDDSIKAADLNGDGKLDRQDAYIIVALIEDLMADGRIPMGGIGVYNYAGGDHEVTMHVDQRGHRATWGFRYNPAGRRSEFSWQSRRFADIDRRDEAAAAERAAKEGRKYQPPRREPLP